MYIDKYKFSIGPQAFATKSGDFAIFGTPGPRNCSHKATHLLPKATYLLPKATDFLRISAVWVQSVRAGAAPDAAAADFKDKC
jgi:hypothetical protein